LSDRLADKGEGVVFRCSYPGCPYAAEMRWHEGRWVRAGQHCGYHRELAADDPRIEQQREHAARVLEARGRGLAIGAALQCDTLDEPTDEEILAKVGRCQVEGCDEVAAHFVSPWGPDPRTRKPTGYKIISTGRGLCAAHAEERDKREAADELLAKRKEADRKRREFEAHLIADLVEQGFPRESVVKFASGDLELWDEDNVTRDQVKEIEAYLESGTDDWRVVILTGAQGRGKSALATLLAVRQWRKNPGWHRSRLRRIEDRPFRDKLNGAHDDEARDLREGVMERPLFLVWDEAGTKPTDYGWSLWREMLEAARRRRVRLLVASNRTLDGLRRAEMDSSDDGMPKVFSRLHQVGNYGLEVSGIDKRDPSARRKGAAA